ncbi:MAG: AMP-binding protein [Actinobacteria bacterium]|nr:AMP-binding protein [Actinomycetota bacterium]
MTEASTDTPTGEVSYGRRLTEIAAERPDAVDLIVVDREGNERAVTWRELETRANQIARALAARGVQSDDIVALALPSCVEHVFVTVAIWKLGATLLPLRHDLPAWEMDRMLALATPRVLVSDQHTAGCQVLTRADLAATDDLPGHALPDAVSDCVNLVASSGSTGFPKLIVTPSRGVVGGDAQQGSTKGVGPMRVLVLSPLYHVNGFAFAAPAMLEGGHVVILEKFDASRAVDLIRKHQITFTVMVPTMLQRVARLADLEPSDFASLHRIVYGGAKVPDWVVERWLALVDPSVFVFTYGSSEKVGLVMMTGAEWPSHPGAAGLPFDCELSIRDEAGTELPPGEIGEIHMRPTGPRRMFEYIGVPTPEPSADGYYTIGDVGWLDEDGYLYVTDRRTDMIVSGGANVFPAEVENALSEHPAVVDQVVVGVPDDEWGQRVHAILQVVDPHHPPTDDELRAFCKERLASYKTPKTFEVVERVPRTEAGKLNRNTLGTSRAEQI